VKKYETGAVPAFYLVWRLWC